MSSAASLRVLLRDVVDYAGFFPPADLSLEDAFRKYVAYRRSSEDWMLGRFVCKADQLAELDTLSAWPDEDADAPLRFSVLAGRGDEPAAFLRELERDVELAGQFHERHAGAARVEAAELRLPAGLLASDTAALNGFLHDVLDEAEDTALATPAFFLEIPLDEHADRRASLVTGAIAGRQDAAFGLKLRCGGPAPADHPAPDRLATALLACLHNGVPFKATAGLHHPFRHDETVSAAMHGFVNLFAGAVLTAEHDLGAGELQQILEDDEAQHFTFGDEALRWREIAAGVDAIHRVRRSLALSFGSCSFDDPRKGLRSAGLL